MQQTTDRSHDDLDHCEGCGEEVDFYVQGNPVFATAVPCGCEVVP